MYGSIAAGIALSVTTLPRGFTHQTMLVLCNGINATFQRWGEATLALAGKRPVPHDSDVTLNRLGYWTDYGSAYYYNYAPGQGLPGHAADREDLLRRIPLAYMQLDSRWYPRGSSGTWQGDGTARGGEHTYRAAPDLFPDRARGVRYAAGLTACRTCPLGSIRPAPTASGTRCPAM